MTGLLILFSYLFNANTIVAFCGSSLYLWCPKINQLFYAGGREQKLCLFAYFVELSQQPAQIRAD